jgi:ferredoxin
MKRLAKSRLPEVLKSWAKSHAVACPTKMPQGDIIYDMFDEGSFTLDYGKPSLSPKSYFLPHSEVIFEVVKGEYKEKISAEKTIIFGVRACDMTGIAQMNSFMTRDNVDPYYQAKLDSIITVVMACRGPQNSTCFCTTTRSGPVSSGGFGLQFYDIGDDFLVEAGNKSGESLFSSPAFTDIDDKTASGIVADFRQKASDSIPVAGDIRSAMNELEAGTDCSRVWDTLGSKCITCGGCTFVCPTCTCFNVYDQAADSANGVRIKAWDACLYGGFTKEASGHNPRGTQALRLQRRHEHKLLYYNSTDIVGTLCGCVGCGRCSDSCPVHIGTLEVTRAIVQDTSKQ